jgi:branched-chain amino acid transport system substrate-binding protein
MNVFIWLGGQIAREDGIEVGERNFRPLLGRIKTARPDGVYFGGLYTEAGLMVGQMRELGMRTLFISGDGAKTPGFFDVAGQAAEGVYLTTVGEPVENLPAAAPFVAAYKKRWNGAGEELRPYDHYGYEAAQILFDALAKAGPDRARLIDALHATRHEGFLGLIMFDAKGDTLNKIITMTRARVKDRTFPVLN